MYEAIPELTWMTHITDSCFWAEEGVRNGRKEVMIWGEEHNLKKGEGTQDIKPLSFSGMESSQQEKLHSEDVIVLITEEIPARQYLVQNLQLAGWSIFAVEEVAVVDLRLWDVLCLQCVLSFS